MCFRGAQMFASTGDRGPHPKPCESEWIVPARSRGGHDCWYCNLCDQEVTKGHLATKKHVDSVAWALVVIQQFAEAGLLPAAPCASSSGNDTVVVELPVAVALSLQRVLNTELGPPP